MAETAYTPQNPTGRTLASPWSGVLTLFSAICLLMLGACTSPTDEYIPPGVLRMSIVNTTSNTYKVNGKWHATDGPISTRPGGLACDKAVGDMRFHSGEYLYWHIAPSDTTTQLGMSRCAKSKNGEPACSENWHLCGRKVRIRCLDSEFCGMRGEPSLLSQINRRDRPVNNYIPRFFVDELSRLLGRHPLAARSVVLYITDFCPADHAGNKSRRQCQGPQVDVSTSAFLLMGSTNPEGYINTNVNVSVELLDADDPMPAGPEYQ